MTLCREGAEGGRKKVSVCLLFWQKRVDLRVTSYYLLLRERAGQGPLEFTIYDLRLMIYDR